MVESRTLARPVSPLATVALIGMALLASACAEPATPFVERPFDLIIMLTSGLEAGPHDTLPEDLMVLALPLASPRCPGVLFRPNTWLLRLDRDGTPSRLLEVASLETWESKVQNFWGKGKGPERLTREMRAGLEHHPYPADLLAPADEDSPVEVVQIMELLEELDTERVVVVQAEDHDGRQPSDTAGGIRFTSTAEDAAEVLAQRLCEQAAAPTDGHYLILYKPEVTGGYMAEATGADPTCDAQYLSLWHRLQSVRPQERPALDAALRDAQNACPTDYRFSYARATMAVYGLKHHDEAFDLLARAAEIAITNGTAPDMLRRVLEDGGDGEIFERLGSGHHEWEHLIDALRGEHGHSVRR